LVRVQAHGGGRDARVRGGGLGVRRARRSARGGEGARLRADAGGDLHVAGVTAVELRCAELSVREVNAALRALPDGTAGRHRGAPHPPVGLSNRLDIAIAGNAGYFIGGLCDGPAIDVDGFVGWSAGENLSSGLVRVRGNASECAGASSRGGLIVIEGDASSRAG